MAIGVLRSIEVAVTAAILLSARADLAASPEGEGFTAASTLGPPASVGSQSRVASATKPDRPTGLESGPGRSGPSEASSTLAPSIWVPLPAHSDARVTLEKGRDLVLMVRARSEDTLVALGDRFLDRGAPRSLLQEANPGRTVVRAGSWYRIPFASLSSEWKIRALESAFPKDGPSPSGWVHRPSASPLDTYGEGAWQAASWFTGEGNNFGALLKANRLGDPLLPRGREIVIPVAMLDPALRGLWDSGAPIDAAPSPGDGKRDGPSRAYTAAADPSRSKTTGGVTAPSNQSSSDRLASRSEDEDADSSSADEGMDASGVREDGERAHRNDASSTQRKDTGEGADAPPSPPDGATDGGAKTGEAPSKTAAALTFSNDQDGDYALYRLKPGEAIYSSVVVRFTGRVDPDEVAEAAETIAKRSGIRSMTRIPAGFPILIPRTMVLPEFLPADDPRRQAIEAVRREAAKVRNPVRSRNLEGIHVILDAGHGGVDPGALIGGVAEHEYVYDVMCRAKRILERETSAIVHPIIEDHSSGFLPRQERTLRLSGKEAILTNPEHVNDAPGETSLGVNLRWYLANSILHQMVKSGVDPTRAVFVSFHADVLHPSLRGAMVYVPGERYRRGSYGCRDSECTRYAEVREAPSVRFSRDDRVVSEGLSRQFAGRLVKAFSARGIRVHPYQPVRDRIIRRGRAWLPAVLRGNGIPVKVLVEIANLNNPADRALMQSSSFRESVARAFTDALLAYYRLPSPPASSRVAETRATR